jgi:hypothetical protein
MTRSSSETLSPPPDTATPPTRARSVRSRLLFGAGVIGAVLVAELALRPLTTPLDNRWDPLLAQRPGGRVREVRRFTEGIAASHYSRSRERLTGHPFIATAPNGVILGDSYVEAVQVPDQETMGSVLERSLRAAGKPINVHQYGWSGADVPQYVLVASDVLRRWDPPWVIIVLTANDLGPDLFEDRVRLVERPGGGWDAVADSVRIGKSRLHRLAGAVLSRSVLAYHLMKRAQEAGLPLAGAGNGDGDGGPASIQQGGLPLAERARVALSALRQSYGDRLRILFIADVGIDGRSAKSPAEEAVAATCQKLGIRWADTRARMTQDRLDSGRVSRGFINSIPGRGHINAIGHALAGQTMLDLVAP